MLGWICWGHASRLKRTPYRSPKCAWNQACRIATGLSVYEVYRGVCIGIALVPTIMGTRLVLSNSVHWTSMSFTMTRRLTESLTDRSETGPRLVELTMRARSTPRSASQRSTAATRRWLRRTL